MMRRREALWLLGAAGAMRSAGQRDPSKPARQPFRGLKVGLTSYSTRKLTLDQTLETLKSMNVRYLSLKDMHLPLASTREERLAARKKVEEAGIQILGCGVIYFKNDEAEIRRALEYAHDIGAPTVVAGPDRAALPTLDRLVKDYDLRVAIHNHGPEDKQFPSPLDVLDRVRGLDERIGCCVDVGHTFRLGLDPAAALRKCAPRLYDIHMKDLAAGSGGHRNVPLGLGVMDVAAILRTLVEAGYSHHVALEYESEPENPIPGIAASFGYMRGLLDAV